MVKYTKNALFPCAEFTYSLSFYSLFLSTKGGSCKTLLCTYSVFTSFISFHKVFFHFILLNVNKSPLEISLAYLYFTATKFLFYFWDSSRWYCTLVIVRDRLKSQAQWYDMRSECKEPKRHGDDDGKKTRDNRNGRMGCCWYMCVQCCWLRKC